MIIFGGTYLREQPGPDQHVFLNDTWALSLKGTPTWSMISASGALPPGRDCHTAIYDRLRERMVISGGFDGGRYFNDTWDLSLGDSPLWSEIVPQGILPSPRGCHASVYDEIGDRMVVSGGTVTETWSLGFEGEPQWTRLNLSSQPPSRSLAAAVYDPVNRRMVLFGGGGSDTWALSLGQAPAWSELLRENKAPFLRSGHSSVYDSRRDRMIVFGGAGGGAFLNETWSLTLGGAPTWSPVEASGTLPQERKGHVAIYDSLRDRVLVFGGSPDGSSYLNDLWELSLAGGPMWTNLAPLGAPPNGRFDASAIYDPVRDRMIMFGGYNPDYANPWLKETWQLSLSGTPTWSRLNPAGTPPAGRRRHVAVYDATSDEMIVFGGETSYEVVGGDVWSLSLSGGASWESVSTAGASPEVREGAAAIYDRARDRMVIFGGMKYPSTFFGDVWALPSAGHAAWSELLPSAAGPVGRSGATAVYDPRGDEMLIFGGLDDTWALVWGDGTTEVSVSLVSAEASINGVRLVWLATEVVSVPATVYRRAVDGPWLAIGEVSPDGTGHIVYEDPQITGGARYGYRLMLRVGGQEFLTAETWIDIPSASRLWLGGLQPNPTRADFVVNLSLQGTAPARLEIYDLIGRRVVTRDVGGLGPGSHNVEVLESRSLPPGVYLIRLSEGLRSVAVRGAVIR